MIRLLLALIFSLTALSESKAAYNPFTPEVIKVTNTNLASANLVAATQFNNFNTTPVINTDANANVFTSIDSDGVNCARGTYLVDIIMYQESTSSSRINISVETTVDGVATGRIGASGYMRRQNGHNEATTTIYDVVNLTSPGKIGFRFQRIANSGNVSVPANESMMRITRIKD